MFQRLVGFNLCLSVNATITGCIDASDLRRDLSTRKGFIHVKNRFKTKDFSSYFNAIFLYRNKAHFVNFKRMHYKIYIYIKKYVIMYIVKVCCEMGVQAEKCLNVNPTTIERLYTYTMNENVLKFSRCSGL